MKNNREKSSSNKNFVKVSELSESGRKKLRNYWSLLFGQEYATDLTTDYTPEGKSKKQK